MQFFSQYDSRLVIYDRRGFVRLATDNGIAFFYENRDFFFSGKLKILDKLFFWLDHPSF